MKKIIIIEDVEQLDSNAPYSIINQQGKVVRKGHLEGKTIDVTHLKRGAYLITAMKQQGEWTMRFLVE